MVVVVVVVMAQVGGAFPVMVSRRDRNFGGLSERGVTVLTVSFGFKGK